MAFQFGEWTTPDGQHCPVDESQIIEIERREGTKERGAAGLWSSPFRHQNSWYYNGGNCDIVRYRQIFYDDAQ